MEKKSRMFIFQLSPTLCIKVSFHEHCDNEKRIKKRTRTTSNVILNYQKQSSKPFYKAFFFIFNKRMRI